MSACFFTHLDVTLVDEKNGMWVLDSPLTYFSEIIGGKITVPEGFSTDFSSVPRIPVVYLLYANRGRKAAVIHDYLYTTGQATRGVCDAVFREALIASGESAGFAWSMWAGVRVGASMKYRGEQ